MIWLLRFEWAGQTWYLSTEFCTPTHTTPGGVVESYPHYGTLEPPEFAEALSWHQSAIGDCSTSLKFRLDLATARDIPYLHFAENQRLEAASGELSLWKRGDDYENRQVVMSGPFVPQTIPLYGRPISGTLSQRIPTTVAAWPPFSAQVTTETWPNLPVSDTESDDENGFPYPVFLGSGGPYVADDGTARRAGCIQAIYVDDTPDTLLFSYGHVTATTVRIGSVENGTAEDFAVTLTTDGLGQPVSVADISGAAWAWVTTPADDTFYVTELDGGLANPVTGTAIRGLGDAILFLLLQRYGDDAPALVDVPAWQSAGAFLNAFLIGLTITESGDPLDVITSTLLPLCPALYLVQGPNGLRPVVIADDTTHAPDLVARVGGVDGPDLFREPDQDPEIVQDDPINTATVYFALRVRTSDLRASTTLTTEQTARGAASATIYGQRATTVEAPCVYDRDTANRIAAEYVRLYAYRATWDAWFAPLDVGAALTLGQRVRITDEAAGYSGDPMTVIGRQLAAEENGQGWLVTAIRY